MREETQLLIRLDPRWSEVQTVDRLEQEAARMHACGWYYAGSHVDELFENVALFFERDAKEKT